MDKKRLKELYDWKTAKLGQVFYNADPAGLYSKQIDDANTFLQDPEYKANYSKFPFCDPKYPKERDEMISNLVWYLQLLEEFYEAHSNEYRDNGEKNG